LIVVSDASPIISLAAAGQLELLRLLYEEVSIPEAVHQEISAAGPGQPGVEELQAAWIKTKAVKNRPLVRALEGELDQGEAEAIALAVELDADVVLVDERRGRVVALRLGLNVLGVMAVLLEAKQKGFLPQIRPVLDDLLTKAGFRISQRLYAHVIQMAGE
jgi:uncharacterized protein